MRLKITLMILFSALPVFAQARVTIYADAGQHGVSQMLANGKNAVNSNLTNKVSSIAVPDGFIAEVCGSTASPRVIGPVHEECFAFPEGKFNFHTLNDRVTKVIVTHPAVEHPASDREHLITLFTGRGHTGNSFSFGDRPGGAFRSLITPVVAGTLDGNASPQWKAAASSIWIADGWYAVIDLQYGQDNPPGPTNMRFEAGYHDFPAAFDNRVQVVSFGRVR